MRAGHWDAVFGFAGDMALGSLLDAGARVEAVNEALRAVGVPGLRVEAGRGMRCGLDCARVVVRWDGDRRSGSEGHAGGHEHGTGEHGHAPGSASDAGRGGPAADPGPHPGGHHHAHGSGTGEDGHLDHGHPRIAGPDMENPHASADGGSSHHAHAHTHRAYRDIREILARAPLAHGVRTRAEAIFARLAEAEGRVHGSPPADVHFHEVGGEDAIGDVVGVAAALEDLGISALTVSPLPAGGGTVSAAHGRLPVPAPAVALLLQGFDWGPGPVQAELVTPTGAAILSALCRPASSWPELRLEGTGWGAGSRDFPGHPNACRFVWGTSAGQGNGVRIETLVEIETHIDDQTPEVVGHLYERVFAAGALDVATAPLWMKKQRPGVRFWVLTRVGDAERVAGCILEESSALGLRMREVRRWSLPRSSEVVQTRFGGLRVKVARLDGRVINAAPEYEDCRAAAEAHGVPLKVVFAAAVAAWEAHAGREQR